VSVVVVVIEVGYPAWLFVKLASVLEALVALLAAALSMLLPVGLETVPPRIVV
jgi:hypothetical protein